MLREDLRVKLEALQEKINERGIVDIKWTIVPDANDINEIAEDMIHVLEAFFEGRMRPLPPIGDSHCRCDKVAGPHVQYDHPDWNEQNSPEAISKRGLDFYMNGGGEKLANDLKSEYRCACGTYPECRCGDEASPEGLYSK